MNQPSAFAPRHLGPTADEQAAMLAELGYASLEDLTQQVVPRAIRQTSPLNLPVPLTEEAALRRLRQIMGRNKVLRSFLGLGYHDTFTPPVILRNVLENPGWYTAYTPYQAEISQGRLELLLHFQTLITDLTGLDVANASLLDEGTACAEALALANAQNPSATSVLVASSCHAHILSVVRTRMQPLGLRVITGDPSEWTTQTFQQEKAAAVLLPYPDTHGVLQDWEVLCSVARAAGTLSVICADLLALTLLQPPGEFGADIAVGNTQRFGVPLGFGGPHAAYMAVRDSLKRRLPGRLVGLSRDADGRPAYRLSLQTREQHIRREKATSNICTAQVLPAILATCYAIYHGPDRLRAIARRIHSGAVWLAAELLHAGLEIASDDFFDTLTVHVPEATPILRRAALFGINLRADEPDRITIALDERIREEELLNILTAFGVNRPRSTPVLDPEAELHCSARFHRETDFLRHPVFHQHHTETAMMRHLRALQARDIALDRSMIPLGSCTMKLNAAAEMMPLSWPEVNGLHPFAPADQATGWQTLTHELETWLAECTGLAAVSLQPNAGSQGELAGLLAIRRWFQSQGDDQRNLCLIPTSAHGTNPASAVMAGLQVLPVRCDEAGNIDVTHLTEQLEAHPGRVAALMVTYPSTHGVFEETIGPICELAHRHGAQVYMDGANLNAQLGLTSPGLIGADVCHLNLHKTFCIPHGGGGPGVGPIAVAAHLQPFLPGKPGTTAPQDDGAVCSAFWGSASILTISWMYLAMMGPGLTTATGIAILNANYIARRLRAAYPTLYTGRSGLVAHECILDFRHFKKVTVEDVAKRLMDYGFHAPTMSWPVAGTLMVEPTESESRAELDRFIEALLAIHQEIVRVESGEWDALDNPLKNAPHTAEHVSADTWTHPYPRAIAAYPLPWLRQDKYWPPVSRIDNVHGDRHLICTCPSVEEAAATE